MKFGSLGGWSFEVGTNWFGLKAYSPIVSTFLPNSNDVRAVQSENAQTPTPQRLSLHETVASVVQDPNAISSRILSFSGKVMEERADESKQCSPIVVSLLVGWKTTVEKEVQSANVAYSRVASSSGIEMVVRETHLTNAERPSLRRAEGKVMLERATQSEKTWSAIFVTVSGLMMDLREEHL